MNRSSGFAKLLAVLSLILCLAMLLCACNTTNSSNDDKDDDKDNVNDTTSDDDTDVGGGDDDQNTDDNNITYTVTVKDLNGNPVSGVGIQFCIGENCFTPVVTDENGKVVVNSLEAVEYHVTVQSDAYAAELEEYSFEKGSTTLSITVYKLPDGSAEDPIPVVEDTTTIKVSKGEKKYYIIRNPEGRKLTVNCKYGVAVVEYNGQVYTSTDGTIEITLVASDDRTAIISFSARDTLGQESLGFFDMILG